MVSRVVSSSGGRLEEVLAQKSWRQVDVNYEFGKMTERQIAELDGYCYLLLARPDQRDTLAGELGRNPTLERVMALGSESIDFPRAWQLVMVVCGGVAHIQPDSGSVHDVCVADMLAYVAHKLNGSCSSAVAPGTLGYYCVEGYMSDHADFESAGPAIQENVEGPLVELGSSMDQRLDCSDVGGTVYGASREAEQHEVSSGNVHEDWIREVAVGASHGSDGKDRMKLKDAVGLVSGLVSSQADQTVGLVWVPGVRDVASHVLERSNLIAVSPGSDRPLRVKLAVPEYQRAILVLPVGWQLEAAGVQIGAPEVTTVVAFRGSCNVWVVPPGDLPERLVAAVLVGSTVNWVLDMLLHPKSTDARFVRELGFPTVLKFPKTCYSPDTETQCTSVEISDPLEDWKKLKVTRLDVSVTSGVSVGVDSDGLYAITCFRSRTLSPLNVQGYVKVPSAKSGIGLSGRVLMSVGKSVQGDELETVKWSVHQVECADPYCMDNGGPSDDEFSDAI